MEGRTRAKWLASAEQGRGNKNDGCRLGRWDLRVGWLWLVTDGETRRRGESVFVTIFPHSKKYNYISVKIRKRKKSAFRCNFIF
jgi:hypothetical protein